MSEVVINVTITDADPINVTYTIVEQILGAEEDPIYSADKSSIVFAGDDISRLTNDAQYVTSSELDTALSGKSNSNHTHDDRYYTESEIDALLSGIIIEETDPIYMADKASIALKSELTTKADLVNGTVPASQLPSYVDDVLEYNNATSFPVTGETGKIYVAKDTNLTYRWSGSAYIEISQSLALGETSSTAYRGDRGKNAYDHSQVTGNPHSTTINSLLGSDDIVLGAHYIEISKISSPSTPVDALRLYAKDVSGETKLFFKTDAGLEVEVGSGGGGGVTEFTSLIDAPNSFTDQALKGVRVNAEANALEFYTIPSTPITSVFGRTGDVVAQGNDYTWDQIDKSVSDIADIATKSHTSLTDIGTNTHSQIDSHIASTSNPHSVTAAQTGAIPTTEKGAASGVATLDTNSKIPTSQLPDEILSGLHYKGLLDASSGSYPVGPTSGDYYIISVAGTISGTTYAIADWAAYNGSSWDKIDNQQIVYTASNGIKLSGKDIQIDLSDTNPSLEINDGGLRTKVDDSTIERTASGLSIKDDGITNVKIGEAISVANGGTGLSALGDANQIIGVNAGKSAFEYKSIVAGANVTVNHSANQIEISANVEGSTDYIYTTKDFHSHLSSAYTWTNMPAAVTAMPNILRANLDGAVSYRIGVYQTVAGYAGADLNLQYSINGSNWYACDDGSSGEIDVGTGTGLKIGSWTDFVAGAKQDVQLRLVGKQGDGVVDPQFRAIWVEIKYNGSIVDMSSSSDTYKEISILSSLNTSNTWTSMPVATTELLGNTYGRVKADLSNCTQFRIIVNQSVAGYAGSDLNLQYSLNQSTWLAADSGGAGETDIGTGTGLKVGAWATLISGAKGDVFLRIVGKDGNGSNSPVFRQISIQFKEHSYGSGVAGSDTQVLFNDGGNMGADAGITYNKDTNVLSVGGIAIGTISGLLKATNGVVSVASAGTDYAAALGSDDNYVTDTEKSNLHAPGSDNQTASNFDIKDLTDSTNLRTTWSAKQDALGFTPENATNKSTDATLGGGSPSNTLFPTQAAVKTYADGLLAANDAMVYKGATDCSGNPNYPAGNAGDMYRVSVAGKIGGASGISVEVGDFYICNTDGTTTGDQATKGIYWNVIQTNIVGAYYAGGADVAVADGGTGASDAATARTNLGLGTSDNPQFATIELGAATDTTISRSAAGVIAVEGVVIPSISSTNTLTNKRITKRTGTTTSSATPTINTDNVDFYSLTAQAENITSFTTNLSGTPTEGQTLWIAITGTAARAITWGASFEASTVALPTTTSGTSRLDVGFVWNTVTSKWRCVAVA